MRVNSRDRDQDLSMWMLDVEEVVREIMFEMLPVEYAQAQFSQNEPSGHPMSSLVIPAYHRISWDIPG